MVKKIVGTGVLLVLALALQAGVKMYTLKSPDGKVKLEVTAGPLEKIKNCPGNYPGAVFCLKTRGAVFKRCHAGHAAEGLDEIRAAGK